MLTVENLSVEFRNQRSVVHAVNDVSFEVLDGTAVGIVGETGGGKSATVRAIMGLLPPTGKIVNGSIRLDGEQLVGLPRRRVRALRGSRMGFVGQNPFAALNPVLPIETQVRNVLRAHGSWSRSAARGRATEMLRAAGIAGPERVLSGYPHQLSGGMAQRVVIAMALVLGADLLIADEPTTALDVTVQRQVLDVMKHLVVADRRSLLVVTHDLGVVAQYCDTVLVMYAGRVVEVGAVRDVFRSPAHPYTLGLLNAIPDENQRLVGIPGSVPNLIDPIRGCPFEPRCTFSSDLCLDEEPPSRPVGKGVVRCHHAESILEVGRAAS